jgi:hypothetical protein
MGGKATPMPIPGALSVAKMVVAIKATREMRYINEAV